MDASASTTTAGGENVRVGVRIRPLNSKDLAEGARLVLRQTPGEQQVVVGADRAFTFDHVFDAQSTQEQVFEGSMRPLIESLLQGYNATVFAYGQTSSGKTHTMGSGNSALEEGDEDSAGLMPRMIAALFELAAQEVSGGVPKAQLRAKATFAEVYKEKVHDLLQPTRGGSGGCRVLEIREHPVEGVVLEGQASRLVASVDDVMAVLKAGSRNRATGATNLNAASSRSHAIVTLHLVIELAGGEKFEPKLNFVDLAGSERAKRTGASGERLAEGCEINKGLLALGNVITALCENQQHVKYRDSKVTRLLQNSLGGNSKTYMLACVSPADSDMEETLNTLKYANCARQISNKPIVTQDPLQARVVEQELEIKRLLGLLNAGGIAPPSRPTEQMLALMRIIKQKDAENAKATARLKALEASSVASAGTLAAASSSSSAGTAEDDDEEGDEEGDTEGIELLVEHHTKQGKLKSKILQLDNFLASAEATLAQEKKDLADAGGLANEPVEDDDALSKVVAELEDLKRHHKSVESQLAQYQREQAAHPPPRREPADAEAALKKQLQDVKKDVATKEKEANSGRRKLDRLVADVIRFREEKSSLERQKVQQDHAYKKLCKERARDLKEKDKVINLLTSASGKQAVKTATLERNLKRKTDEVASLQQQQAPHSLKKAKVGESPAVARGSTPLSARPASARKVPTASGRKAPATTSRPVPVPFMLLAPDELLEQEVQGRLEYARLVEVYEREVEQRASAYKRLKQLEKATEEEAAADSADGAPADGSGEAEAREVAEAREAEKDALQMKVAHHNQQMAIHHVEISSSASESKLDALPDTDKVPVLKLSVEQLVAAKMELAKQALQLTREADCREQTTTLIEKKETACKEAIDLNNRLRLELVEQKMTMHTMEKEHKAQLEEVQRRRDESGGSTSADKTVEKLFEFYCTNGQGPSARP